MHRKPSFVALATVLPLALAFTAGCARHVEPAASTANACAPRSARKDDRRAVYRLEFALRAKDASATTPSTTFSIQVADEDFGEMMVGHNLPLPPLQPNGAAPRQDVGLKVKAHVRERAADDLLVDVATELSAAEGGSVRKVVSRGSVLARPGAQAVVTRVVDDTQTYELLVTASRMN
jgi:hypothetical protein